MAFGKVKWFNNAKGYGFILPEEGGEDLFVHYSAIEMDGYRTLKAGQDVQFDIVEGPKGLHAVNIRDIEPSADAVLQETQTDDTDEASGIGVSVELDIDTNEPDSGPASDASSG